MKKRIGFTGIKKDKETGEIYRFKKGVAAVPGTRMRSTGKSMMITLAEFNSLQESI